MLARGISIAFASLVAAIASPSISRAQPEPVGDMPRMNFPVTMSAYPIQAMLGNEEGRVVLVVTIDETGQMSNARVESSSGHRTLDEAAIDAVNASRLSAPPTNAAGEPVGTDVLVGVNWELAMQSADEFLLKQNFELGITPPVPDPENLDRVRARDYPANAIWTGRSGIVGLEFTVTEGGFADELVTVHSSGVAALNAAARNMISRFRWTPAMSDGQPVAVRTTQIIHFMAFRDDIPANAIRFHL